MIYWVTKQVFKLYFLLFCHLKIYGTENIIPGKCIIAPNHASFYDPPLIAAAWPSTATFLARKTLFKPPVFDRLLGWLNTYPVGGTTDDLNSLKTVCHLLHDNNAVVIFPEGTRTPDGTLQPIKSGIGMLAMRNHADIIPVYIHGSYDLWPRSKKYPSLTGTTACVFGTPIHWDDFKGLSRKEAYEAIAQQTTLAIARLKEWYDSGAEGTPP